jgi:hypothetical protein
VVELNSKFKYEEVEEEKEERMSLKGLFRQNSSSSIASQASLPASQNDANGTGSSGTFGRPRDGVDTTRVSGGSFSINSTGSQLELIRENNNHSPDSPTPFNLLQQDSSFTNFAFQADPEEEDIVDENPRPDSDLEKNKTEEEERRHFEADIHAPSERRHAESPDLSHAKLNGGLEGTDSSHSLRSAKLETNSSCDNRINESEENEEPVEPSKPLLFLIHGISGSSDIWKSQFEYFHDHGYEIIAPDLLGHGLSSTPNTAKYYLFESLVQDLATVFDHFIADERKVVIVGHGYG